MELFEKYYGTYRFMVSLAGLWPYSESTYRTVHRILFFGILLVSPVILVVLLLNSENTAQRRIQMLSKMCPLIIFCLRYFLFIMYFPTIKILFEHVRMEEHMLDDSNELQILARCFESSSYIINTFLWSCSAGLVVISTLLLAPVALDIIMPLNESRARHMYYIIDLVTDRTLYSDIISLLLIIVYTIGILTVVCTEAALNIFTHYSCGLFKIVSYRIQNAVNNVTASEEQIKELNRDFGRAIDIHRRAIRYVNLLSNSLTIPYAILIPAIMVSFATNLDRMSRAIASMDDGKEISTSITVVAVHLVFITLCNHCGQLVKDESSDICNKSYSSIWYEIPLEAQKLLVFVMLRSSIECSFSIPGFFVPCYRGLSAMLSTSVSYFTVMFSVQ